MGQGISWFNLIRILSYPLLKRCRLETYTDGVGYRSNRLDEPVFITVPKPLLTEFCTQERFESCLTQPHLVVGITFFEKTNQICYAFVLFCHLVGLLTERRPLFTDLVSTIKQPPEGSSHIKFNWMAVRIFVI